MKRHISGIIKPSFLKSYYFKTFIIYSFFMLIIVITYSFILTKYMNNNLEKEISKSNQAIITQVQIYSDAYIENIYSILTEKFLDISKDEDMHDFFFEKNSLGSVYPSYQSISDIVLNNKYVDSVVIYRKSDNIIVSSKKGLIYPSNNTESSSAASNTNKLIEIAMSLIDNRRWLSPDENPVNDSTKTIISLVQPIPMLSSPDQRLGCIIINLNEEDFFNSVDTMVNITGGELMIIDSEGKLFAHNKKEILYNSSTYINNFIPLLDSENGFTTFDYNGDHLGVTWTNSSINDWKYVSIVPIQILNQSLIILRQFSLLILGVIVLIGLLGFNAITSWLYRPLKMIVNSAKEKFDIKDTSNEIALINNVIESLSIKVDEMQEILSKNEVLIENKVAFEILNGNYTDTNEIYNKLSLIGKDYIYKKYTIVITEISMKLFLNLTTDKREYIAFKMIDIINDFFNKECICISICNPCNRIVTIINHKNKIISSFDFDILQRTLEDEIGIVCNIAISNMVTSLKLINKIYSTTCNALKYSFIYGYGNIFTHIQIARFETSVPARNLIDLGSLTAQLTSGKIMEAKNEIIKSIQQIGQNGYSYDYAHNMLIQITNIVLKVIRMQNFDIIKLNIDKKIIESSNIEFLDDYRIYIFDIIDKYHHSLIERNSSIDNIFIDKIKTYISDNINNQISLNAVAEHFKISTGYLSNSFKQRTGIKFSSFVIDKKIERAAELLISKNNFEINEIAEKIGYSNAIYFSKLFKEKYGMTPIQYRKNNV